ncbi:MAG: DUF4834 domain-containing protein [Flavobacteriaceae bacterium]|nr:DUF4834 domain-containing protein [Flavobacteriaceae bacterium]|tara:strand:+ start:26359 stop:26622 length:264 start_codon:yes stop_codon:yes gene_type:complete
MAFLKTILIILLVYFGVKFSWRLARPYVVKYIQRKMSERFQNAFGNAAPNNPNHQSEGEVTIDRMPNKQRKTNDGVGEYVSYEEVEE